MDYIKSNILIFTSETLFFFNSDKFSFNRFLPQIVEVRDFNFTGSTH